MQPVIMTIEALKQSAGKREIADLKRDLFFDKIGARNLRSALDCAASWLFLALFLFRLLPFVPDFLVFFLPPFLFLASSIR